MNWICLPRRCFASQKIKGVFLKERRGDMDNVKTIELQLDQLMPLMKECLAAGQSIRFSPRGISMLPMLREGADCVILSPVPEKLKKYDIALYQRDNGQYVLHRIIEVGETYSCMGDNQFVKEFGLRYEQMIAVVTVFYRGEEEYSVRDLEYWLYCRFWHLSRPVRYFWRRGKRWLRRHLRSINW